MDSTEETSNNYEVPDPGGLTDYDALTDEGFAEPLNPGETIDIVSRRFDFLTCLSEGPKHKPVLTTELGVSRSTVYKGVRELEERNLVERVNEGYQLSPLGHLFVGEYDRFRTTIGTICRTGPLLSELNGDCALSVDVLTDCDVVYSHRHAPHHPARILTALVDSATSLRGMSSVVLPGYVDAFCDSLSSPPFEAELVLSRQAVEWLRTYDRDTFEASLQTGQIAVSETDDWLPFGLLLCDEPNSSVGVFVYDEHGGFRGALTNDTPEAVAWGQDVWQRFRERATPVELEDFDRE